MSFYNLNITSRDDYFFIFNSVKCKEFIITHKKNYIKIKGYKTLINKKIVHKNRVGNIMINLLNKYNLIIELLQKYKTVLDNLDTNKDNIRIAFEIFSQLYDDLLKLSPSTFIIIKDINKSLWDFLKLKKLSSSMVEVQSMNCIEECSIFIEQQILYLKHLKYNVEKIYSRISTNKKGYVKYENPIIHTPTCTIIYKKKIQQIMKKFFSTRYKIS